MDRRKLSSIVSYISRSLSAAALMVWGVVNIVGLAMQYFRSEVSDANWGVSWSMSAVFGLLPFLLGSWLLYRNVATNVSGQSNRKS